MGKKQTVEKEEIDLPVKKRIDLPGATLPFYKYIEEGITCFEFDSTRSDPPIPMVNAMRGLGLLKDTNDRLVMINMQEPTALYPRIADEFSWDITVLENGDMRIEFRMKNA